MAGKVGGKGGVDTSQALGTLNQILGVLNELKGTKVEVDVDSTGVEKLNDALSESAKKIRELSRNGQKNYFATQEKMVEHLTRSYDNLNKAQTESSKNTAKHDIMRWANAYRGAGYSEADVKKEIFDIADEVYRSHENGTGKKNSMWHYSQDQFKQLF